MELFWIFIVFMGLLILIVIIGSKEKEKQIKNTILNILRLIPPFGG